MNKFICLFLLAVSFSVNIEAFEIHGNGLTNHSIDSVIASEEGLFLHIGDSWLRVDAMEIKPEGILVLDNGSWLTIDQFTMTNYFTWICPICGTANVQGVSKCRNSKNHPKK